LTAIGVSEFSKGRILVTRQAARSLAEPIGQAWLDRPYSESFSDKPIIRLDFSGVAGTSPSFFDELIRVVDEATKGCLTAGTAVLSLYHLPSHKSRAFDAIVAGRGLKFENSNDGSLTIRRVA